MSDKTTSPAPVQSLVGLRPFYDEAGITIYHADCFEILPELRGLDAIVTDCPYSSGGAFRGDRMSSTLEKYASSDSSQQAGIGFTGDDARIGHGPVYRSAAGRAIAKALSTDICSVVFRRVRQGTTIAWR